MRRTSTDYAKSLLTSLLCVCVLGAGCEEDTPSDPKLSLHLRVNPTVSVAIYADLDLRSLQRVRLHYRDPISGPKSTP